MKNLLYTLLIGLIVISCNKEDDGADYSAVAPLQEVTVGDFDAAKATLDNLMGVATPIKGASAPSTAKVGNSLRLVVWDTSGNSSYADGKYAHVISEEHDACYDKYAPEVDWSFDWDGDNNVLTITIDGADTTYNISEPLASTYDGNFANALYFLARVGFNSDSGAYFVDGTQPAQVNP